MTNGELDLLHQYLDASVLYLEFGAGDSTLYAAEARSILKMDSVESSHTFIENLKSHKIILEALEKQKMVFHEIDIGETGSWGYPMNYEKKHLWPNYSLSVFSRESKHDLIFIDGRFRVSCALNALLNTPPSCKIMIHDFWDRPYYHVLLKYLDVANRADTLGVFTKKGKIDRAEIQKMILAYQYLPGDEPGQDFRYAHEKTL